MGMDSRTKLRAVDRRTRLEGEREDVGVERKRKGSLHVAEKSKGLVMTTSVDV